MKTCNKCGVDQPLDAFYKHAEGAMGRRPECKPCFLLKRKAYYSENREKVLDRTRDYQRRNPEKVREMHRVANIRRRQDPEWAEQQREYNREYGRTHRTGRLNRQRLRLARLAACEINDFTPLQWERMKAAYDWRCAYCGLQTVDLQTDHVIPLSRHGNHTLRNIVPACEPCNLRKATRTEMPFQVIPSWFAS